jgi:hypothetical protein
MISAFFAWDMKGFLESYGSRIQWTRLTEPLLQRSSQHIERGLKRGIDLGAYSRLYRGCSSNFGARMMWTSTQYRNVVRGSA